MKLHRLLLVAAFLVAVAGTSYAMSDGNYDPDDMGCKQEGNAFDPANDPDGTHDPHASPDHCQALRIGAGTDANPKFVRVGLDHEEPGPGGFAGGHNPHHGTAYVGSPGEEILQVHYGTGITQAILVDVLFFGPGEDGPLSDDHDQPELEIEQMNPDNAEHIDQNPPNELHVFFGADDNLESGEHDGVPEQNCEDDGAGGEICYDNTDLANGPSDGGEIRLDVTPNQDDPAANIDPGNPDNVAPAAYAGMGACVDGICFNAGTGERQVYDGGQPGTVYLDDATADDYKDTDDYCSYDNEGNCVREVHDQQQDFYSRPGINIYADPDPQDSSLGPFDGSTNTHVGTGGIKILGVSVIDAQDPTGMGSAQRDGTLRGGSIPTRGYLGGWLGTKLGGAWTSMLTRIGELLSGHVLPRIGNVAPGEFSGASNGLAETVGLSPKTRLHDVRQGAPTLLEQGAHPAIAPAVAGNSTPAFTMNVDPQVLEGATAQAGTKLGL